VDGARKHVSMSTTQDDLVRMLCPSTGEVTLDAVPVMRASDRSAEYETVRVGLPNPSHIRIVSDPEVSFAVTKNVLPGGQSLSQVSLAVASRFGGLARNASKVVSWIDRSHSHGEMSHYLDNLWVVTGTTQHERLLCWHKGGGVFVALHHCPGTQQWLDYNHFLNMLERGYTSVGWGQLQGE